MNRLATSIFEYAHLKKFWSAFNFCESVSRCKNQIIQSVYFSDTVNYRVLPPDWPHPFLTMLTPKMFTHLLICAKLYQPEKNQLIPTVHSWDTLNFRVPRPDWPQPFLTMTNRKNFYQLLIFVTLYQHAKNEAVSLIRSGKRLDLKSCNLIDWEHFSLYLRNKIFPNKGFVQEHSK